MSWRKKHIFINLSWHGGHGPLLSPFEGLEVPKLYRSSIVWPGLSKTPAPLFPYVFPTLPFPAFPPLCPHMAIALCPPLLPNLNISLSPMMFYYRHLLSCSIKNFFQKSFQFETLFENLAMVFWKVHIWYSPIQPDLKFGEKLFLKIRRKTCHYEFCIFLENSS